MHTYIYVCVYVYIYMVVGCNDILKNGDYLGFFNFLGMHKIILQSGCHFFHSKYNSLEFADGCYALNLPFIDLLLWGV